MARNEEKAMAMLNRWVTLKRSLNSTIRDERPKNPMSVKSIGECNVWREELIRDITK
jgi:pre-mRNA-splicing factor ISY1